MRIRRVNILLLFFFGFVTAHSQTLLDQYIPIPPQELSVEQFLFHIEDITDFHPAFSSAIVGNKRLALYSDSLTVKELLDTLFFNFDLQYIIRNDQLILSPQTKTLQEQNRIKIAGQVRHSRNDLPIPFANVFVPFKSMGTMTNADGKFELVIPLDLQIDSIMVTCMGYTEKTVMSLDFLQGPVEVNLVPHRYQIEELIVRPEDPISIIRGVLENKEKNYSDEDELLTAFFREVAQQNDKYISLSEAVVDIYKTSYSKSGNDMVKLRKGRRGSNIHASALVNLVVEGGLYHTIQLDIMKYGVSFLDPEMFDHYVYNFERQIAYNDRQTYIISFDFKDDLPLPGFSGRLLIDVKTLGLVRAEFSFTEESLTHAYSVLVKKVPKQYRVRPRHAKYSVEYRLYDDRWNLSQARSDVAIRLRKKREKKKTGYACKFKAASEFIITGKSEGEFTRIKYRDASKPDDILYEQVAETDLDFWGTETTIIPEEPLQETIEKLKFEEGVGVQSLVKTSD